MPRDWVPQNLTVLPPPCGTGSTAMWSQFNLVEQYEDRKVLNLENVQIESALAGNKNSSNHMLRLRLELFANVEEQLTMRCSPSLPMLIWFPRFVMSTKKNSNTQTHTC